MLEIVSAAVAVIVAVFAIRAAYGAGKAAGNVEVKFPLRESLKSYGLHLSYATEQVRPMDADQLTENGLVCPEEYASDFRDLREKLRRRRLDVHVVRLVGAAPSRA